MLPTWPHFLHPGCLLICILNVYDVLLRINAFVFIRQHGQDTKEEIASRDLRTELESKEREAKEKREGKTRSFTGQHLP